MANNYLIAYDISCPRRLVKIHRFLSQIAIPVQYSVFFLECTIDEMEEAKTGLKQLMDLKNDDIRIYRLPSTPQITTLGRQRIHTDILFLSGETNDYLTLL